MPIRQRTPLLPRLRNHPRRILRHCVLFATIGLAWLGRAAALAQEVAGSPEPASPLSRDWTREAVIVGALFGLALFAICRSSRRN